MTQFAVITACPKCKRDDSWSVWIGTSGQPMGTCHRAQCSHGSRQLSGEQAIFIATPKKKEPRYYTRPIRSLTTSQEEIIKDRFGIHVPEVEGYNEADDRFILPVYGPVGHNRRGSIAYSFSGGVPKSLTYNEKPEQPFVHYAGFFANGTVVVEDWFSAEKVSMAGAMGAAIMGTNLTQAMVTELAENAGAPAYLALDRDAYSKTIGYIAKYREQFPLGLYAWSLRVDLKYESTERIKRALDGDYDFNRTATISSDAKG